MTVMTSGKTKQEEVSELLEEMMDIIESVHRLPTREYNDIKNALRSHLEHKVLGFGFNYEDSIYDDCITALSPTCQADWDAPITHRQAVEIIEGVREDYDQP